MIVYFDASAFVKLLLAEDESSRARALWDAADVAVSSRVLYPEVRSALAAAVRARRLSARHHEEAKASLRRWTRGMRVVELAAQIGDAAGDLADRLALRGIDAIHLASAMALLPDPIVLATWDRELAEAARRAGLATAGIT